MPRESQYEESQNYGQQRSGGSGIAKLATVGIILAILAIVAMCSIRWETVKGNELGIKETFSGGVQTNVLQPKTYMLWRGFEDIIQYDVSSKVYDLQAYKVQSVEGQDLKIDLSLRWRIDPARLVEIHKTLRENIEKKVIESAVQRIVKDEATKLRAIDAYSGTNLVNLQKSIQDDLLRPESEIRSRGVIVENFVIKHIELDEKYVDVIKRKQVATQEQAAAVEEQKAAEAKALVAKATAQADMNKKVVEAERDAKVQVLAAEADQKKTVLAATADQEKAILAAKGEQQKSTLESEGKMQAALNEAKGIEALGRAKAEAQRLQLQAYDVKGADAYVTVEVAKSVASGMQNISGLLPSNMSVSVISEDILKSVQTLVKQRSTPAKQ
jgi:regulator of protease activity HflC (stomatin/prohibitin superfamily)